MTTTLPKTPSAPTVFDYDVAATIVRESAPGIALVVLLGYLATLASQVVTGLDALVAAVVLGMVVRRLLGTRDALFFKLLPGIIVAQTVLVPLGIALYGKNLDLKVLLGSHPLIILQVTLIACCTFVLMYVIGRRLGFKDRVLYMLGFGSAVCGASAIAVTAPVTECEPDETAVGLVNNTVAVVICLGVIAWLFRPIMSETKYAALAGSLMLQTGFVKMALSGAPSAIVNFGLAVKSVRVAMLIVGIPAVSYLLHRRFYLPWFLVAFAVVGVLFSYASLPGAAADTVVNVYNLFFTAALASVGLNADFGRVGRHLFKPLGLILVVFAVDLGLFLLTAQAIAY